jgi:hypothetical protein
MSEVALPYLEAKLHACLVALIRSVTYVIFILILDA